MSEERIKLTDKELMYAATGRCRCGAGLAHPLDHKMALAIRAWVCSAVLKGEGQAHEQSLSSLRGEPPVGEHDSLDFAFYKVREETSINNRGGHTTRPPGTIARTIGKAKCPKCSHEWQSEPYIACGLGHHWFSGPCPGCGYAVAAGGSWSTSDGDPIDRRYPDVVLECTSHEFQRGADGKHRCGVCRFSVEIGDGV